MKTTNLDEIKTMEDVRYKVDYIQLIKNHSKNSQLQTLAKQSNNCFMLDNSIDKHFRISNHLELCNQFRSFVLNVRSCEIIFTFEKALYHPRMDFNEWEEKFVEVTFEFKFYSGYNRNFIQDFLDELKLWDTAELNNSNVFCKTTGLPKFWKL